MTPALRCDFVIVECINFSYARQVRVIVDREARCKINRMPALSKDDKLRLLRIILESRHADLREQNLIRQGKGHFTSPGWATKRWRRSQSRWSRTITSFRIIATVAWSLGAA